MSDAVTEARETPNVVAEVATSDIPPDTLTLPNEELSIKFAVIGDSGRGTPEQHAIAAQMEAYRKRFDFGFVLMGGDNIYEGPATPEDYRLKFEEPYKPLLDAGVKFYAVLGNHDDPAQIHYPPFHMDGHRYYTFTPPVGVLLEARHARPILRARQYPPRRRAAAVAATRARASRTRSGRSR